MADLITVRRVTVIADASLETDLLQQFEKLGATGYTAIDCRGKGTHEVIENPYTGVSRVRIELLVRPDVATQILDYLSQHVFDRYAGTACVESVDVLSKEQF